VVLYESALFKVVMTTLPVGKIGGLIMNIEETVTYKEIMQQSTVWPKIENLIKEKKSLIDDLLKNKFEDNPVKVLFTGAGSSAYIGDFLENHLMPKQNMTLLSVPTTEILTDPEKFLGIDDNLIIFSFARSGNSPESKGVISLAEKFAPNAEHIFVTNNKDGFLANYKSENVSCIVLPEETNDKSLAMTSSYSTMLITASLLLGGGLSKRFLGELDAKFEMINKTTDSVLTDDFDKTFYVGTGVHARINQEISLKMNELTSGAVHVNSESTLGFRHGPKAALTSGSLYIQFFSNDEYKNLYETDLAAEMGQNDHYYKLLVVPDYSIVDTELNELFNVVSLEATNYSEYEIALLYLVFGQLLACKKSISLGINPDNPSPDGYINRVVQGVTLYDYEEKEK